MSDNLFLLAKKKNIKYFLISFVDLFGMLRSKLVPASAIIDMKKNGAGFAGFAAWLDLSPADGDVLAMLDESSLIQLPWNKDVGWLASDLYLNGNPIDASPRVFLKKQIAKFDKLGYRPKTGVECEFFLLDPSGENLSDPYDNQQKPCYDQQVLMRHYDIISEACDVMLELGWEPYQNDHEDANGQYEMNWAYDDVLLTADRHTFFKFMIKSLAEKHGMRATFMPKPYTNLTGNGCHSHISLWNKKGDKNLFLSKNDSRKLGLSELAYNFVGGILDYAVPLTAFFNPTVNSYKRIGTSETTSGASWSPSFVTYSGNNRTHLIRVPAPGRFELRLMDGASNPYLLQGGTLSAGLLGIKDKINPGEPLHINMYEEANKVKNVRKLPENLLDALRLLESNKKIVNELGKPLVDAFLKLKHKQWRLFTHSMTEWERKDALDC